MCVYKFPIDNGGLAIENYPLCQPWETLASLSPLGISTFFKTFISGHVTKLGGRGAWNSYTKYMLDMNWPELNYCIETLILGETSFDTLLSLTIHLPNPLLLPYLCSFLLFLCNTHLEQFMNLWLFSCYHNNKTPSLWSILIGSRSLFFLLRGWLKQRIYLREIK